MFSTSDLQQMETLGISPIKIEKQIDNFRRGFPFIRLDRSATIGDGILRFDDAARVQCIQVFDAQPAGTHIEKFVPASGAASRMFKQLFEFKEKYTNSPLDHESFKKDQGFNSVFNFIINLGKFAFYDDLKKVMLDNGIELDKALADKEYGVVIDFLLSEKGLGYANLPKALLKFHNYPNGARVAAEEHLVESAVYAKGSDGEAHIHYTLSPEHIAKFQKRFSEVMEKHEQRFKVHFQVSHSIQKKSTDVIAVDENNEPVRNPDGSLLFRPGGHGALLENLQEMDADLIFIKNIDNIVPDSLRDTTYEYKKVLGGFLFYLRDTIFSYLDKSSKEELLENDILLMWDFARNTLFIDLPEDYSSLSTQTMMEMLQAALNRPMRICGMVKNEGEPGGGPFWVTDDDGKKSLQIVESSQMDFSNDAQKKIVEASTHFNPVDLVCITKNFKGEKFNLSEFVDPHTGFISLKSSGGKTLKAQELPGLWNGAMANWITVFAEVPIITFNPVKTVNDLLRKEHQA
jgi:hypothetical protein